MKTEYQALILISFGGPEGPDDVLPFLENVLKGRNVPRERMLEVAHHYDEFGGVSPINEQNRNLIGALEKELSRAGPDLPIYWGNRNWSPLLEDTLRRMQREGVRKALAFVTSAYSSYSSCRQYLEDIERAKARIGPRAPQIDKLRLYYNHPGFIAANAARVTSAFEKMEAERNDRARLVFTAHSVPLTMANNSMYEVQLRETARLVAEAAGRDSWDLVYQSRSGPPHQPWLEPEIGDFLPRLRESGVTDVVLSPIGFISDHMEVLYDLDHEAAGICAELGLNMVRAGTAGDHPEFVRMIRDLILERIDKRSERRFLGELGPAPDFCPADCCKLPQLRNLAGLDGRNRR